MIEGCHRPDLNRVAVVTGVSGGFRGPKRVH